MNILCIGDIVGSAGCEFLRAQLPGLKSRLGVELVVANGENSADGNGMTPASVGHIFTSGVQAITGGNHSFRRREVYPALEAQETLLRPYNSHPGAPGKGLCIVDMGRMLVAVVNLLGSAYLDCFACPFDAAEAAVREAKELGARVILVDFHAEATSEKRAMGFLLDGQVSAVFGTHTHAQTADEQILPAGTGYISDLGMTGPFVSVLGVKPELAIKKLRTKLPVRFENAPGPCALGGCVFEIDEQSGLTRDARRVWILENA